MKTSFLIAACALLASANASFAHNNLGHGAGHGDAPTEQLPWGQAGQPGADTRTIELRMGDDMRFVPDHFTVARGETVRLRVLNQGQVMHEAVLGTAQALQEHAQAMREQPGMAHGAPYMAHVAPQQAGDLVWQFNRAGSFDFACLVAGHFEAGMRGHFTVTP